jgi:TRAP-type C4-dicarboxylate transport system permease small subunit
LNRLFDFIDRGLLALSSSMLLFIAGLTLVQVFFRYVLSDALSWSAELTRIVFIWMTFIAGGVAINRRRHLRIDTFTNLLPKRSQFWIDLCIHLIVIGFFVFLSVWGFRLAERTLRTVTGALRWPRSVFFLPVAIGGVFFALFAARIVAEDLLRLRGLYRDKKEEDRA